MITIPDGYINFILFFVFIFIVILPLIAFLITKKIKEYTFSEKSISQENTNFFKSLFSFQKFPIVVLFTVLAPAMVFLMLWSVLLLDFDVAQEVFLVILLYFFILLSALCYILFKGGLEWKK